MIASKCHSGSLHTSTRPQPASRASTSCTHLRKTTKICCQSCGCDRYCSFTVLEKRNFLPLLLAAGWLRELSNRLHASSNTCKYKQTDCGRDSQPRRVILNPCHSWLNQDSPLRHV